MTDDPAGSPASVSETLWRNISQECYIFLSGIAIFIYM